MMTQSQLRGLLENSAADDKLMRVYGGQANELESARARLLALLACYGEAFGCEEEVGLFTGPGRTEMGGNHTDHQHGRVLAGAVNLDAIACAGANGTEEIRIQSAGYPEIRIRLSDLSPNETEYGTSAALVRGVCARFTEMGYALGGFNACIASTVLGGSGLSSSAAYEVLIGVIVNHLFCSDEVSLIQIAQIGQYAENVFFGKPCGLMDQLASAVGGIVSIDFRNPAEPVVSKVDYDLSASGHALCIIDSGADHADLTNDYAAITEEMGAVAAYFGKSVLREVDYDDFWASLPDLRNQVNDRALLRAIHFFSDNLLAKKQAQALERDDFSLFLSLVHRSGLSSARHLQNLYSAAQPMHQAVPLAIALAEQLLDGEGAVRVHGGGFAGTIQAYVPLSKLTAFKTGMEAVLGEGRCHVLRIRPVGGAVILA